ncbi:Carboxymuconolactone decarboxylase [Pyrenophora teres f. maculata]|nr:Carboxymuconolactone decarboxylase [Pyrenophora teres f. maculata]
MVFTSEQKKLKEVFEAEFGSAAFDESWARMLIHSPEMFAASVRLTAAPKKTSHLTPKIQALISLAVSAASTHLHLPSIHRHTRAALAAGATREEIVETLCLTSTLGIHAATTGLPLLFEVLEERGEALPEDIATMSPHQLALKADFEAKRGYWHKMWEQMLVLAPDFFDAFTEFSSVPWTNEGGKGVLEPKVKELIYCAFDASATHMYSPGLKLHIRNVLDLGGTKEELVEVMELATLLSISTLDVGLEVLDQEMSNISL